ncbi:MAG: hypothetical protein MUP13_11575, partial [Thermoanaerobaculales bacterium]|nr:hypothetical protein [Thermoanaerobaculales bacterium]
GGQNGNQAGPNGHEQGDRQDRFGRRRRRHRSGSGFRQDANGNTQAAASADLVIVLWAADGPPPTAVPSGVPVLQLRSKADLGCESQDGWLPISSQTGQGLEDFRRRLTEIVLGDVPDLGGAVAVASRHRASLERARVAIDGADWSCPELAAEDVRWALRAAEELCGEVDAEALLDEVFAAFCVGK